MAPPVDIPVKSLSKDERRMVQLMRRGTGQPPPREVQPKANVGQWLCHYSDCIFAVKHKPMFSHKTECMGCFRPKNRAMNPPRSQRLPPSEPTTSTRTTTAGREQPKPRAEPTATRANEATGAKMAMAANMVTARANLDTPSLAPGPVAAAFDAFKGPTRPKPVQLAGATEAERIGAHPLDEFDVSTLYHRPPQDPPPLLTAEGIVSKLVPVASSKALEDKEAAIAITRAILAQCPEWHPGHAQSSELLKTQEAEMAKLKKQAPAPKVFTEQLKSARQGQHQLMTQWHEKTASGKASADARLKEHLKILDDLSMAILERRTAIVAAHHDTGEAWNVFNAKRNAQWKEVLAQLDAKVATAEVTATTAQVPLINALAIAGAARVPVPVDNHLNEALSEAQRDAAEAKRKVEELERRCQEYVAATKAAELVAARVAKEADQALGFQISVDDLPSMIPEPEASQWELYHVLYMNLEHLDTLEAVNGGTVHVTFSQMKCGLDIPHVLLGDAIWTGVVTGDSIIIPRVRKLMVASLKKHMVKLVQDKAKHDAAIKTALAEMDGVVSDWQAKKRKAPEASPAAA